MAIKLCKDCRWFGADEKCRHETALVEDFVYGKHTHYFASAHRRFDAATNSCGRGAKWFEPREAAQAAE